MTKTYNTPKRSHIVKTRLDDEEHADFLRRLEIYDMNQSEFIREAISGATIKPTIVATLVSDDLLAAIGKLTAEYGRIGNNLNQIARHLNEWHSPYPVMANLPESSGQNDHLIAAQKTRERIASETGTSESYVLHPTIRNKLAIDPEAAEVVRKIFLLAIDGNTPTEIAIRLNDEGIPTPGQYFIERHPDTKKYRRSSNKLNWSHAMVYRTLTKLVYIGCAVGHERRTEAHPRYAPPQSVAGHDRTVAPSAEARLHPLSGELVPRYAQNGPVSGRQAQKSVQAKALRADNLSRPACAGGCQGRSPPLYRGFGAAPVPVHRHRRVHEAAFPGGLPGAVHLFLGGLPAQAAGVVRPQGHRSGVCPDGQRFRVYQPLLQQEARAAVSVSADGC